MQAHKAQQDSISLFDFGASIREENARYAWSEQNTLSVCYDLRVTARKVGSVSSAFLQDGDIITAVKHNANKIAITQAYQLEELFYGVETGDTLLFSYTRESVLHNYTLSVTDAYMKKIKIT